MRDCLDKDNNRWYYREFVPFDLAVDLEKIGLKPDKNDYIVPHYIPYKDEDGEQMMSIGQMSGNCVFAPTYEQVLAWMREVHDVHVVISAVMGLDSWSYELVDLNPQSDMSGEFTSWIPEKSTYPVNDGYYHNLDLAIKEFIYLYNEHFPKDEQ